METAFDHDPWLRARHDRQEKSRGRAGLDWSGLAGRFAAVHAFQSMVVPRHRIDPEFPGSFDAQAARRLAEFAAVTDRREWGQVAQAEELPHAEQGLSVKEWSPAVNLILSADGKAESGIRADVAGPHMSGTRGLK